MERVSGQEESFTGSSDTSLVFVGARPWRCEDRPFRPNRGELGADSLEIRDSRRLRQLSLAIFSLG